MTENEIKNFPKTEITEKVTAKSVDFAKQFASYLAPSDRNDRDGLKTSQLRKFFGEVKRQQMHGYQESEFLMLKPKLAYAVGRAKANRKGKRIEYFYLFISLLIDYVINSSNKEMAFKNFITIFEAVVAYHKVFAEN